VTAAPAAAEKDAAGFAAVLDGVPPRPEDCVVLVLTVVIAEYPPSVKSYPLYTRGV
jgi:hypothetical protein